jgi:diguanylate cyclase (GGDEF)-like protein
MENVSSIISIQMYTEVFHIEPDLCGCIIHDFKSAAGNKAVAQSKAMRRKPNCDFLTGFYNRFYLQEIYDELSTMENIGIAFLDINNLKLTNDTVGHAAGDALILQVSSLLKAYYADSMIFRLGGDEFGIITQGQSREVFMETSNKLKQELVNKDLAAIGFNYYEKPDSLQKCINECDSMMYNEKKRMKQIKQ